MFPSKMLKFSQLLLRSSKNVAGVQNLIRLPNFSTATTATVQNVVLENDVANKAIPEQPKQSEISEKGAFIIKSGNAMVTAAFAALNSNDQGNDIKTPQTDARLEKADSVNELLSVSDGVGVSRKHALKVCRIR